ncbi:Disease resistance protein RPS4B [Linum grandiflorum]
MVKYELLIKDCPLIESLPDISNLVNDLREVYIEYCWKLKSFPSGISNLISVHTIRFCGTDIKSLPSSIHQLGKLAVLELEFCRSLESIPDNIHQLAKLNQLSLWGCIKIQYLPQAPPELKYLYVGGCKSLKALPSNTEKLKLCDLWVENCFEMDYKLASAMAGDFHSRAPASEVKCPNVGSLKGIPFGVLFSVDDTVARLCVKCDVVIERSTVATFSSPQCLIARDGIVGSPDYVLLWVNDNLLGETKEGIKE